ELLLIGVGQALDGELLRGQLFFAQNYSVARAQAIRQVQRFAELHLRGRHFHGNALATQFLRQRHGSRICRRTQPPEVPAPPSHARYTSIPPCAVAPLACPPAVWRACSSDKITRSVPMAK